MRSLARSGTAWLWMSKPGLRQVDLLQFQRDEIAAANLTLGEEEELTRNWIYYAMRKD